MEIGTINVTAILGPYVQPVITASVKFGIPYFLTEDLRPDMFRPSTLLSVRPGQADLSRLTLDIVRTFEWKQVAVIYDLLSGWQPVTGSVAICFFVFHFIRRTTFYYSFVYIG